MTASPPASPEPSRGSPGTARADTTLDVRGLNCPLPVLKARKLLKGLPPGSLLEVQATDPASVIDFRHFCETAPFELVGSSEEGGTFHFLIKKPS
jgi:tRNA 2-thiouridine synthesizing protein A